MGYRHYLVKVGLEDVEKVNDLDTVKELEDVCNKNFCSELNIYDKKFLNQKMICELGKLQGKSGSLFNIFNYDFKLFNKPELQTYYEHNDPIFINKTQLRDIINIFKDNIKTYYESLFKDNTKKLRDDAFNFINIEDLNHYEALDYVICRMRSLYNLVNLDLDKEYLTENYLYENQIFNLIHLYKTIDWDKERLIVYG